MSDLKSLAKNYPYEEFSLPAPEEQYIVFTEFDLEVTELLWRVYKSLDMSR